MRGTFDEAACRERLQLGVRQLGIEMGPEEAEKLLRYLALLMKWNRAYNLTAVRDPLEMVARHLLDSLAVLPYLQGQRCLDMGTGPGLPGIPLAVLRPRMAFTLLDANGKKTRFVRQAVLELGLGNVEPVQARLEHYRPAQPFDLLISRAFTSLARMLELSAPLRGPQTLLLAMKGDAERELAEVGVCEAIPLRVPYVEAQRTLLRVPPGR